MPTTSHMLRAIAAAIGATFLLCAAPTAHSQSTEAGDTAWHKGATLAMQGNADAALAEFAKARDLGKGANDSLLLAAALRASAEVLLTYRACNDSVIALLREAIRVSVAGDRGAASMLLRVLASRGQLAEARQVHAASYADVANEVPRTITRESITFLTDRAAIQRAAGQHTAALGSLTSARDIAARLATGDATDSVPRRPPHHVDLINYWVMYDMAQLRLASKTAAVMSATEGKALMDAVAQAHDTPPTDGDQRRFPVFRLADRLTIKATRCQLSGDQCPAPRPIPCR